MKKRIDHLKNFGFVDEVTVTASGINGKMSELNSALGILQLRYIDQLISQRRHIDCLYRKRLNSAKGIKLFTSSASKPNFAYFPILITEEHNNSRDQIFEKLNENGIITRKYFYPLIAEFPMYRGLPSSDLSNLKQAKKISEQILCLPIYPDLQPEMVHKICDLIT
jgi:dTDP-4-amino-4,6-dideoxygalactose transaminase